MADLEINNHREFFKEASLNDVGFFKIEVVNKTGSEIKPNTMKEFFKLIKLNSNG